MPIPPQRDLSEARQQLCRWLAGRLPEGRDVVVSEITGPSFTGFSNETLMFDAEWTADGQRCRHGMVARVQPGAHSIFLEAEFEPQYRVMDILGAKTDVRVPRLEGYEADTGYLGAPFFVMEKVAGRIPTDDPPYHTAGWVTEVEPGERASMWWSGLEQLAAIHNAPWEELGLDFVDKPARGASGLDQQLSYYEDYFEWARAGREHPVADAALAWIKANRPGGPEPLRLCWGDSRVGNMIFDRGQCVAVLDWEMVTLGNPIEDLAWWLYLDRHHSEGCGVSRLAGFPGRDETVARWSDLTGLTASDADLRFYEMFASFRFALIMMRVIQMVVDFELLPPDTDMGINNTASQLLAKLLEE